MAPEMDGQPLKGFVKGMRGRFEDCGMETTKKIGKKIGGRVPSGGRRKLIEKRRVCSDGKRSEGGRTLVSGADGHVM
jgi:hypothetical protein